MNSVTPSTNSVKQKHYGFAQVPRIVIRGNPNKPNEPRLSMPGLGLYTALKDICGDEGECFYSMRSLAQLTGWDKSTIDRHIPELVAAGKITAEKLPSKRGPKNWHIRIINVWPENDIIYGSSELSQNGTSDSRLSQNETSLSHFETTRSKSTRGLSQNETKEDRKKNLKEEEGSLPPPPLVFPSEKTIPSPSLIPSEQIPPPASSNVPPDVQIVIDAYIPIATTPVDVKKPKFMAAATFLARFKLTTEDLSACRQWMIEHDRKGRFKDHVPNLVEISYDFANWKADMARKQDQAQLSKPGVGVSGKPKIDTTSDDYREFMLAMGGN